MVTKVKAQQPKDLLNIQEIRREKAFRCKASFAYFLRQAWHVIEPARSLIWGIHTEASCLHLQAVGDGELHKLVVNIAPGFGKSSMFSVAFPAWIWTRNPHERFLCASYALDLAIRDNRNCRMLIESEWYQSLFGDVFKMAGDQNVKCLLGSTKIQTDHGELAIQDIVEQKMDVRVLTFNHVKSIIENKYILAYEKHPGRPCVQVSCSNGAIVTCTLNHPFYVLGKGYVEARYLKSGDTVYAREAGVRGMREGISSSLSGSKGGQVFAACMQQELPEAVDTRRGTSGSYLPTMREVQPIHQRRDKNSYLQVLQPCLSREVVQPTSRQSYSTSVPGMWEYLPSVSSPPTPEILFSCLLSCSSPLENTWNGASTLREGIWNDIPSGAQARWQPVYALPEYSAVGSPSYRSQQTEQYRDQFDHSVSDLPSEGNTFPGRMGGMEATTVIALIPDASPSFVYNLEIEDNHNYFANGILTHNSFYENDRRGYRLATAVRSSGTGKRGTSLIIDDPNNGMAGRSEVEATVEWFGRTWASRLNDRENGSMIVVGQRLYEDDLTGHLLSLDGWEHLCLPTEYETVRKCYTSIGWEDPRTVEGQLLCEEMINDEQVEDLKHTQGSFNYSAQQQQAPVPATGGTFKKEWARYFEIQGDYYLLHTKYGRSKAVKIADCQRITVNDPAISEKEESDFWVLQVWAITPDNEILLIFQLRGHFNNPDQQKKIVEQYEYWLWMALYVETVAYQLALYQQLKNYDKEEEVEPGLYRKRKIYIPVKEWKPIRDKVARAGVAAIKMEAGDMYFLRNADYLPVLEPEVFKFPKAPKKDQVDCLGMICDILSNPQIPLQGDEPQPKPVSVPSLTEIMASDPFSWATTHGIWGNE